MGHSLHRSRYGRANQRGLNGVGLFHLYNSGEDLKHTYLQERPYVFLEKGLVNFGIKRTELIKTPDNTVFD